MEGAPIRRNPADSKEEKWRINLLRDSRRVRDKCGNSLPKSSSFSIRKVEHKICQEALEED